MSAMQKIFVFLLQQYFISHFTDHLETSWRLVSHQKQTNLSSAAIGSICHESSGNLSFSHLFNGLLDNHCVDTYLHDCLSFIIVWPYNYGAEVFEVTSLSATTSSSLYARLLSTCAVHAMKYVLAELKSDFFDQRWKKWISRSQISLITKSFSIDPIWSYSNRSRLIPVAYYFSDKFVRTVAAKFIRTGSAKFGSSQLDLVYEEILWYQLLYESVSIMFQPGRSPIPGDQTSKTIKKQK